MSGPSQQNTDFGYDPAQAETVSADSTGYAAHGASAITGQYNTGAGMENIIGDLSGRGSSLWSQAQEFLDPNSQYYKGQRGHLSEAVADATQQTTNAQNQMFAQRGIGSGGIKNILSNVNANRSGESVRQGMKEILNQGVGQAATFSQLANQATGQAGTLQGGENQRSLQMNLANMSNRQQTSLANAAARNEASRFGANASNTADMFNAGQTNQANQFNANAQDAATQYNLTSTYNQNLANAQSQDAWNNQWLNMGLGIALAPVSGGGSLIGAATGLGTPPSPGSDRRLKKNIDLVGKSDSGVNIYEFDYKDNSYGDGRYVGVMADEVPYASIQMSNGYLNVDYSKLDVNFRRIS